MNKNTLYNILLIACPAAAIVIASGPRSVRIFDRAANVSTYQSYFDLLPENAFAISTVLAMGLAIFALIFAIAYVVTHNAKHLKAIYLITFASVFVAEIPTLMQNELLILPNVSVPILLIVPCAMAYSRMKKPQQEQKKKEQGQRLQPRR